MNVKRIFPLEFNYRLRHFKEIIKQSKPILDLKNENEKRVYFLDAPEYGNLGDQAIAYALQTFMKDNFKEYSYYEIQEDNYLKYYKWLKNNIRESDIICLMGGGNMGDLYQRYEAIRRSIIKTFKNNKIIIFPQTIDYGADSYGKREIKKSQKIYNSNNNLLLMAREEKTYNIMRELYKNCTVILTPDIVLYLDYKDFVERKNSVGLCLRNDKEKILKDEDREKIFNKYKNHIDISTHIGDSVRINENNRREIVENKLKQFSENSLVITDRLHGMIFSYITNTPCIAFNNSNGKIKGVYKWIEGKGKVNFVEKFENYTFPNITNKNIEFKEVIEKLKLFLKIV